MVIGPTRVTAVVVTAVVVLYGAPTGLRPGQAQKLTYADLFPAAEDAVNGFPGFPGAVTVGDLNGDGVDDLGVGAPTALVAGQPDAGAVGWCSAVRLVSTGGRHPLSC